MTKIEARCPSSQGGPESTVPQTLTVTKTKVNEISEEKERKWSVSICCTVASIVNLLVGISLSIPSNVILDLTEENGFPPDYRISSFDQSVFAVSVQYVANRCRNGTNKMHGITFVCHHPCLIQSSFLCNSYIFKYFNEIFLHLFN